MAARICSVPIFPGGLATGPSRPQGIRAGRFHFCAAQSDCRERSRCQNPASRRQPPSGCSPSLPKNCGSKIARHGWRHKIYSGVLEKLRREPVEDFRIDFEDGYGNRPDAEEDQHAKLAAEEVAKGFKEGSLPPFIGIRLKPFSPELRDRSIRTLNLFVSALCEATRGRLPSNFVVTLPKVVIPEQMAALAHLLGCDGTSAGAGKRFAAIRDDDRNDVGHSQRARRIELAALPGCRGRPLHRRAFWHLRLHGKLQHHGGLSMMDHPACDFAKNMMQVAFAGTGLWLSDGATNVLPTPPHRAEKGKRLTRAQQQENIARPCIAPGGCTMGTSSIR